MTKLEKLEFLVASLKKDNKELRRYVKAVELAIKNVPHHELKAIRTFDEWRML